MGSGEMGCWGRDCEWGGLCWIVLYVCMLLLSFFREAEIVLSFSFYLLPSVIHILMFFFCAVVMNCKVVVYAYLMVWWR